MTDQELLEELLFGGDHDLPPTAREAFTEWYSQGLAARGLLSKKQIMWLRGHGERKGLVGPQTENLFSALKPAEQARQKARAAAVLLPWEREAKKR